LLVDGSVAPASIDESHSATSQRDGERDVTPFQNSWNMKGHRVETGAWLGPRSLLMEQERARTILQDDRHFSIGKNRRKQRSQAGFFVSTKSDLFRVEIVPQNRFQNPKIAGPLA
jgi:hypothetical protein